MIGWEKKLQEWVGAGLIDARQSHSIVAYEKTKKSTSYVQTGLISLGVVSIFIGLISIISFNWQTIPDLVKLACDFLLFCLVAGMAWYFWTTARHTYFDITIIGFLFLIPASIGLISQIYHLSGHLYEALFLSCALSLPVLYFTRSQINWHLWYLAFTIACLDYLDSSATVTFNESVFFMLFLGTAFFSGLFAIHYLLKDHLPATFYRVPIIWSQIFCLIGALVVSVEGIQEINFLYAILSVIPVALFLYVASRISTRLLIYTSFSVVLYGALFWLSNSSGLSGDIVQALLFVFLMIALALAWSCLDYIRLFNLFFIFAGIRLWVVYFEVLGDLATTGFGLIGSGVFILVSSLLYIKYKERIQKWIQSRS